MYTCTQTQQQSSQQQPLVASLRSAMPPLYHRPKSDSGKKHRQGINLALNCREPSRVTEKIAQRTNGRQQPEEPPVAFGKQVANGPIKKHHRKSSRQGGKCIAKNGNSVDIATCQPRKAMRYQPIKRSSRRMPNLQEIRRGDELSTIPKTNRRLHGQQIDSRTNKSQQPTTKSFMESTIGN